MFYIEEQHKKRRLDIALIHIGPTLIVFLAFFGLTLWSAHDAAGTVEKNHEQLLISNLEHIQAGIKDRLLTYEDILQASAGLFYGSDYVTKRDWNQFTNVFQIPVRFPGLQSVGYAQQVDASELAAFTEKGRVDGAPQFSVTPVADKQSYTPVLYIEPQTDANLKALGYDFTSEPLRKAALDAARDSGQPTQTGTLSFATTSTSSTQPGFLVYLPIYKDSATPASVEGRRQALRGFVFAKIRAQDFIHQLDLDHDQNYGFEVYDGHDLTGALIYKSPTVASLMSKGHTQSLMRSFRIDNRNWSIRATIGPNILPTAERSKPGSVLWGGLVFSTFVAGFIYLLLLNRTNALASKEEREIQAAKDELLALASHQLRTPATGVKQYIGMLRDGYAGELTHEQSVYLDKAYSSNERQLGTINDMLFVARADAGNLELKKQKVNLSDLIRDLVEEQAGSISSRGQSITNTLPKAKVIIVADPQYLRMAIENLLSNATKYTSEGGQIHLSLEDGRHEVHIIIKDTGVGVEEKDYPLLFKKFSRIPNELTNKVSGSGIGLYLVQKIIYAHGGTIEFSSKPQIGSSFRLSIPKGQKAKKL